MASPGMGRFKLYYFCNIHTRHVCTNSVLCSQIAITPVVIQALANRGLFHRAPWANAPIQTGLVGFVLIFATPLGCAFFSQMASINVSDLEGNVRDIVYKKNPDLQVAWYNKGL